MKRKREGKGEGERVGGVLYSRMRLYSVLNTALKSSRGARCSTEAVTTKGITVKSNQQPVGPRARIGNCICMHSGFDIKIR